MFYHIHSLKKFDCNIHETIINEMGYHFYMPLRIFMTSYHPSLVYGAPHPLCYFSIFFPLVPYTHMIRKRNFMAIYCICYEYGT